MAKILPASLEIASYEHESSWSDELCNQALREIVNDLGISGQDRRYLLSMPKICSWFYILGSWLQDGPFRRQLTHAICLHNFGIKLLDDVVDDDTGCSSAALVVVGSLLCEEAYCEMSRAGVSKDYFLHASRPFVQLWRDQFLLDDLTVTSLKDWLVFSQLRICRLMVFYSGFICRQQSHVLDAATTRAVFDAIGDIWTIFDDFRDRERDRQVTGNRHANLALLVESGQVSKHAVLDLLEDRYERVNRVVSAHPPPLELKPFLDHVVRRCRDYIAE